jgi:hypothetical protein
MFTGIVTLASMYFTIGIGVKIAKDDTGTVAGEVIKLIKETSVWPKEIYDKFNKKD